MSDGSASQGPRRALGVSSSSMPAALSWSRIASAVAKSLAARAAARCSSSAATSASTAVGQPGLGLARRRRPAQCGSNGSSPSTASIARTDDGGAAQRAGCPRRRAACCPRGPRRRSPRPPPGCRGRRPSPARSRRTACPARPAPTHARRPGSGSPRSGRTRPPPPRAPRSGTRRASGSAPRRCRTAGRSPRTRSSTDGTTSELPSDLLIFSPAVVIQALCIQYDANVEPGRAGLGLLVLVVREAQVDAAAVDVEAAAEVLQRHRRALDVPAGPSRAPRRGPGRRLRLGLLLPALPEGEVARVALAARVGVLRRLHVVDALVGQLAVRRPGAHVEVHVARAVLGGVGVAPRDQPLDQLEHLRDVPGRGRLVGRRRRR